MEASDPSANVSRRRPDHFGYQVGHELVQVTDGRTHRYRLVRREPYINWHGTATATLTWLGHCAVCGTPFVELCGLTKREPRLKRTCRQHRGQLAEVASSKRKAEAVDKPPKQSKSLIGANKSSIKSRSAKSAQRPPLVIIR